MNPTHELFITVRLEGDDATAEGLMDLLAQTVQRSDYNAIWRDDYTRRLPEKEAPGEG